MTTLSYIPGGVADPDNLKKSQQYIATNFSAIGWKNDIAAYAESEWYEDIYPASSGPCETTRNTEPTKIANQAVWEFVAMSAEDCATATRNDIANQVRQQVRQPASVAQAALDPQAITVAQYRYDEAAVTQKLNELEDTADNDLDGFDPTIAPTDADDVTKAVSNVTVEIAELPPWVGAPNDTLGFLVILETEIGQEAIGSELRINVIDAPKDKTAVLGPGIQDPDNPRIWTITSRDGFKWQDEASSATIRCYWGSGSEYVTGNIEAKAFGPEYRETSPIEYGL